MSEKYLQPEDDGLPMRSSHDYAKDKLRILQGYVHRFITSMKGKKWRALFYIDLQAGPGKNRFDPSGDIMLGSPLIALTAKYPFTHYRFVELGQQEYEALRTRVSVSDRASNVTIMQGDCNTLVDDIIAEIADIDQPYLKEKWPSLNIAFLDPEGLEVTWQTVEKLGQVGRMDLIINFSTSGFTRNVGQMLERNETDKLDAFFGTLEWRNAYQEVADKDITHIRRRMLDFYQERLKSLGYVFNLEMPEEIAFRNRRGAQIYTLIFASKHELGIRFWNAAIQEVSQPRLF